MKKSKSTWAIAALVAGAALVWIGKKKGAKIANNGADKGGKLWQDRGIVESDLSELTKERDLTLDNAKIENGEKISADAIQKPRF